MARPAQRGRPDPRSWRAARARHLDGAPEGSIEMQPVPRRVVQSYHLRYQLQTLMQAGGGPPRLTGAVDLHAHAQAGTENPLAMARRASEAKMGGVVFKNLPAGRPAHEVRQQVEEELQRWGEAEQIAPAKCFHGAQTDP